MSLPARRRPLAVLFAAVVLLTATATVHPAAAAAHPDAAAVHAAAAGSAVALGAPKGCPSGAVCFYRKGNGGDLCGWWKVDAPSLGGCANIGPSGSIFNNGEPCRGCQDVALSYLSNYRGAWYCLRKGHYLLHIEQDHFNLPGPGPDRPGYGQTLAYRPGQPDGPGGVASAYWTVC